MQFSVLITLAFASAAAVMASPASPKAAGVLGVVTRQTCRLASDSFAATCAQGNNKFCTGNQNICGDGLGDGFGGGASEANEAACANSAVGDPCTQTVECCR